MSWQIRLQADDFFNAYQVLKKSGAELGNPAVVNLAFSLELYIKDIYFVLNMKPPHSHSILKLYKKLPRQIKRDIFFHASIIQNPFALRGPIIFLRRFTGLSRDYYGFIKQLEAISDGFEKWRYSYENGVLQYENWFAEALIKAFKSVADNARRRSAA